MLRNTNTVNEYHSLQGEEKLKTSFQEVLAPATQLDMCPAQQAEQSKEVGNSWGWGAASGI